MKATGHLETFGLVGSNTKQAESGARRRLEGKIPNSEKE
jgi:hypothetical protein